MKVKLDFRGGAWHEGQFYRWEAGEEVDLPESLLISLGVLSEEDLKPSGDGEKKRAGRKKAE